MNVYWTLLFSLLLVILGAVWKNLYRSLFDFLITFLTETVRNLLILPFLKISRDYQSHKLNKVLQGDDRYTKKRDIILLRAGKLQKANDRILNLTNGSLFPRSYHKTLYGYFDALRQQECCCDDFQKRISCLDGIIIKYEQSLISYNEKAIRPEDKVRLWTLYCEVLLKRAEYTSGREQKASYYKRYIDKYFEITNQSFGEKNPQIYHDAGIGYLKLAGYSNLAGRVKERNLTIALERFLEAIRVAGLNEELYRPAICESYKDAGKALYELSQCANELANLQKSLSMLTNAKNYLFRTNPELETEIEEYLGKCYSRLYNIKGSVNSLYLAEEAFNVALNHYSDTDDKINLAKTFRRIANIRYKMSEQEKRYANISESTSKFRIAIRYFEELLECGSKDEVLKKKLEYELAVTRYKYSRTLLERASLSSSLKNLNEALDNLKAANAVFIREDIVEWIGRVEEMLITVYTRRAEMENSEEFIEKAIQEHNTCTERMQSILPTICADAKLAIAETFILRAKMRSSEDNADTAIQFLHEAQSQYELMDLQYQILRVKQQISLAFIEKAKIRNPLKNLLTAQSILLEISATYSGANPVAPFLKYKIFGYLALVQTLLMNYDPNRYYSRAFENFTRYYQGITFEEYPIDYAKFKMYEGDCHIKRRDIDEEQAAKLAIVCYEQARCVLGEETNSFYCAKLNLRLGKAYTKLIKTREDFLKADEFLKQGRAVFSQEKFPIINAYFLYLEARCHFKCFQERIENEPGGDGHIRVAFDNCRYCIDELSMGSYPVYYAKVARLFADVLDAAADTLNPQRQHLKVLYYGRALAINITQEEFSEQNEIDSELLRRRNCRHLELVNKLREAYNQISCDKENCGILKRLSTFVSDNLL